MVLRLFVQPGEGKHWIVVKRPEPLPANATPSYSIIASTVLAAGYTSYATKFNRRVGFPNGLTTPAVFVRASARAGIWCAAASAAVNWYYHYGFASHLLIAGSVLDEKWKLYEKTDRYTIDDGILLGAGVGLASAIFLRRMPISWFAKMAGMTNIGALGGLMASNAYFQYTGERQKSVTAMNDWRNRRALEFHWVYWDKLLLSKLSTVAQAYVLCNGIFHASRLPEEALKQPLKYGLGMITKTDIESEDKEKEGEKEKRKDEDSEKKIKEGSQITATEAEPQPAPTPKIEAAKGYYREPQDYTETLREITAENMSGKVLLLKEMEQEKASLLHEAEYLVHQLGLKQYELVHKKWDDEDERQKKLKELQLLNIVWNRLRTRADDLDRKIEVGHTMIAQKRAWDSENDSPSAWARPPAQADGATLRPKFAVTEFIQIRESIVEEVKSFEKKVEESKDDEEKEAAKKDLDDGRALLRAADRVHFELKQKVKKPEPKEPKKSPENEDKVAQDVIKEEKAIAKDQKVVKEKIKEKINKKKPEPGNMEPDKS